MTYLWQGVYAEQHVSSHLTSKTTKQALGERLTAISFVEQRGS